LGGDVLIDIFHLERITTTILDRPHMGQVRTQFLDIDAGPPAISVTAEVIGSASHLDDGDDLLERMVRIKRNALDERALDLRDNPPEPVPASTAAAEWMHVTPSAISQRIKALDQRFGQVLVVREKPCKPRPARS
jgi:hypothetical protein